MSRARTITRRTLMTGALALGGGVAFGTWRLLTPDANPVLASLEQGEASFNPWVMAEPGASL
ncbi:twin-arginine translocation signal domain-containing protein [Roseobacter sp.]|uniref:twin-arginine translocation signal domain-containing protein n=1 Tax=Roseobacter sp. TaxID=1907202 RepID=UPI00344BC337